MIFFNIELNLQRCSKDKQLCWRTKSKVFYSISGLCWNIGLLCTRLGDNLMDFRMFSVQ